MSTSPPPRNDDINDVLHSQLRKEFGEPHTITGDGENWTFQPHAASACRINIMANGTREGAILWVFDPNDRKNGVQSINITEDREIPRIIRDIRQRVEDASRSPGDSGSSPTPIR